MSFFKQLALLALTVGVGLNLAGCQPDESKAKKQPSLTSIAVSPASATVMMSSTQALTVMGTFSNNSSMDVTSASSFSVTSSSPAGVALVSSSGVVTAAKAGTATITATYTQGSTTITKTATATITVPAATLVSIAVTPTSPTVAIGATQALTVTGTYNEGSKAVISTGLTFVSFDTSVATVDVSSGVLTGVAAGQATITTTETASGKSTTTLVTVSAGGGGGASGSTGTCAAPNCTDFSSPGIGFAPFENGGGGTAEIASDPNDAANKVVKFVKKPGDGDYFGTTITGLAGPATLTATSKTVTLRVYSPDVGTNFLLKLEGGPAAAPVVEKDMATTVAGAWETLSFDLSAGAEGTYATVVIFPHGRSTVSADTTMYIDELKFPAAGGGGASGSTGTCAAPNCTDFSSPGIGFAPFENGGGGTAEIANDPNDAANKVAKFVKKPGDGDFFGTPITGLAGPATLTATSKVVTLRVYSPAVGTNFLLKLEGGPAAVPVVEKDMVTTAAGAWETLSFDLSAGAEGTYATVVIFPHGRSAVTADTTMYIDELKFPAAGGGGASGNTGTCTAPCIDFSSASVKYEPFEGLVSAAQGDDPVDAANKVAEFVKGPTGKPWAGATIYTVDFDKSVPKFDLSTNKVVTLRVYSPGAGQKVRLKLEDAANVDVYLEQDVLTTKTNEWETLSFDFTSPVNGVYNAANTYNKVSLIPAFSTAATPADNTAYYFDELKYTTVSGGGGADPIVFASGYASNNRTVEGGEWGFYSGDFTNYSNTYTGGGFVDDSPAKPAADTYVYLVVATSAPTTAGYMGIFTGAPGHTGATPNASVTLTGQSNLKIELGMGTEWFQQTTNKQLTVRFVGSQVYSNGSGSCQILVEKQVTPTTADLTLYTVALTSMTLAQACNGGGFTSGVNTLAEALAKPIGEIHVQAIFPQVNTTVKIGTEYATGFTRGSVSFE